MVCGGGLGRSHGDHDGDTALLGALLRMLRGLLLDVKVKGQPV